MEIIKIISECKRFKSSNGGRPKPGYKRVMASVRENGKVVTRHIDIKK